MFITLTIHHHHHHCHFVAKRASFWGSVDYWRWASVKLVPKSSGRTWRPDKNPDTTTRHDTTRLEWDGVVSNWGNPRYPKISQDIPRYSEIQWEKHHHFPFDCYLTLDFDAINRSNPFWVSKPERSDDPNGLPRIASGRNSTNLPSGNLT